MWGVTLNAGSHHRQKNRGVTRNWSAAPRQINAETKKQSHVRRLSVGLSYYYYYYYYYCCLYSATLHCCMWWVTLKRKHLTIKTVTSSALIGMSADLHLVIGNTRQTVPHWHITDKLICLNYWDKQTSEIVTSSLRALYWQCISACVCCSKFKRAFAAFTLWATYNIQAGAK